MEAMLNVKESKGKRNEDLAWPFTLPFFSPRQTT
jgi:hypothetical protein